MEGPDLRVGVASGDVPEGSLVQGHVGNEAVLLTRYRGELFAIGAHCPHYGAPLAEGLIVDGTIRCPWHHAAFDLRTGDVLRPPALDGLPCWQVVERQGWVTVTPRRAAPAPAPRRSPPRHPGAPESVVILGGGAAGLYAAETLRHEGYERSITIVESGRQPPYDRPNLSKDYLAGTASEDWLPLRPPGYYADQEIGLRLNAHVTTIDVADRELRFLDGSTQRFGALLIATGAEPVRLGPPPPERHVHYLRTVEDCRAIIAAAEEARGAVVLGASFIGLEVAAALRARDLPVTIVAPDAYPLERVLGPGLGAAIRELHEDHGVTFRLGRTAAEIERDRVVLQDGEALAADLVVAGIGVHPRTDLAWRAGLTIDRGIVVDEYLETNVPGIYAAGDVARWPDLRTGELIRVEHWVVAQRQGQTAARNMLAGPLGPRERFDAVPFFWSRHYDVTIAYTGHAERWDAVEVKGDIRARDCAVAYRAGGRTLAVATIGRDRDSLGVEAFMEGDTTPSAARETTSIR